MTKPITAELLQKISAPSRTGQLAIIGFLFLLQTGMTLAATKTASAPPTLPPSLSPEMTYMLGTLGFGGIAGWCVGFTMKKAAKLLALIIGIIVIGIQALAFQHYLVIDWEKIQQALPAGTLPQLWDQVWAVLSYNLPFGGAFLGGLFLGLRRG